MGSVVSLYGMCYCGPMGFAAQIPVHQVGGLVVLWHLSGYGLSKVWLYLWVPGYSINNQVRLDACAKQVLS